MKIFIVNFVYIENNEKIKIDIILRISDNLKSETESIDWNLSKEEILKNILESEQYNKKDIYYREIVKCKFYK